MTFVSTCRSRCARQCSAARSACPFPAGRLRLKGKGAPNRFGGHGDAYVTLKIVLPDKPDAALTDFVRDWTAGEAHSPRETLGA